MRESSHTEDHFGFATTVNLHRSYHVVEATRVIDRWPIVAQGSGWTSQRHDRNAVPIGPELLRGHAPL